MSRTTLSPHRRDQLFGDQWPAMWGMRNRIAHMYSRVEVAVIIATVREDLPEIHARIRAYLDISKWRAARRRVTREDLRASPRGDARVDL